MALLSIWSYGLIADIAEGSHVVTALVGSREGGVGTRWGCFRKFPVLALSSNVHPDSVSNLRHGEEGRSLA